MDLTLQQDHATPATERSAPNDEYRCGICNKTYSRRDLRDRHRRRCIKSIGKERSSKRKSCETCAQKKLRCSMTRPACSRCLQIGIQCRYPACAVAIAVQPQDQGQDQDVLSFSSFSTPGSGPPGTIQPALLQSLDHRDSQVEENAAAWNTSPADGMMMNGFPETAFQDPALFAPMSWNEEFSMSSRSLGQDEEILASISSNQSTTSHSANSNSQGVPVQTFNASNPSEATISSLSSNIGSSLPNTSQNGYQESPYVDFNLDSSARLIFGRNFYPKTTSLSPVDVEDLYQQMFSVLREYPSLILQRDHWSPFVHHRLYRCSMGGMAKPMGVALACVSAHAGSFGSNHGFVDNLINQERSQLVRDFQSYLDTPENCLAAVHAVCIYQILGLFGDNFLPAAIKQSRGMKEMLDQRRTDCERQAELHSSFVLKMTRRLYAHYRDAINTTHDAELNWERWKFSESLRRNIFFANIINILGARAGKLNSAYFEPLDDELVLNLPLPAPECMWRSCSSSEWFEAREYALSMLSTPAAAVDRSTRSLTQTLKGLLKDEEEGKLDMSSLLPLTRVILASTKIAPSGFVF
ncbi:Zn(II)2Cys6 transcription factor domain-containing protein [Aspergillus undulatus]|uniref:Zn(II)2Cys6 transcription factor domain-containing protein n=1 Tax=Aspergillus undulatus TaxID=1810928 RepID=UPI003CCD7192